MKKQIIALGAGAASVVTAVTMAFGGAAPATAAESPAGSITAQVCALLPAQVTSQVGTVTGLVTGITGLDTDLANKQAALGTSISDLAAAVTNYIQIVNNGGNVTAAGQVLTAKNSIFADKVVAENNAMTASFEAHRNAYLQGVTANYMAGVDNGLCGVSLPSIPVAGALGLFNL
jgi:hypothetical protein